MEDQKEYYRQIIKTIYQLLESKGYTQVSVVKKLFSLAIKLSTTTFNNIIKNRPISLATVIEVEKGMQLIIHNELGLKYNTSEAVFVKVNTPNSQQYIIPEKEAIEDWTGITPHWTGRPDIQKKVAFLSTAQKEINEVGVRLNTFTGYFLHRNEQAFSQPIKELFEKGVKLNLYLLDPDAHQAHQYFNDRSIALPEEKHSTTIIKEVIRKLKGIHKTFAEQGFTEQFSVYTYKHLPHNHFLIVDPDTLQGKMMVSHYLYGITRANAPVIEFSKTANRHLFRRYYSSYQLLTEKAKRII